MLYEGVTHNIQRMPSDFKAPIIKYADLRSLSIPVQSPLFLFVISSSPYTYTDSVFISSFCSTSSRSHSTSSHCVSLIVTATVFASRIFGSTEVKRFESISDVPSAIGECNVGSGRYSACKFSIHSVIL